MKLGKAVVIPRSTVIGVMPLQLLLQRDLLLRDRIVAVPPTPGGDHRERPAEPAAEVLVLTVRPPENVWSRDTIITSASSLKREANGFHTSEVVIEVPVALARTADQ